MAEALRINFVLPPCPTISGGPLAILEYANRLAERGHKTTVTTWPNSTWSGETPFTWFDLKAELLFINDRPGEESRAKLASITPEIAADPAALGRLLGSSYGIPDVTHLLQHADAPTIHRGAFDFLFHEPLVWQRLIHSMPDCDINVATSWSSAFPVYLSRKGKPTYFMQHYEEIFYPLEPDSMMLRLGARSSYALPMYKVANSSWLQRMIRDRFDQYVPFSNNGMEISDFNPAPKTSEQDGKIRVVTYSRPEPWKGFPDAVAAMRLVAQELGSAIEWHVFGYGHPVLTPDNSYAPYVYHPKLPFKDLARLYATSDIALCPSWYESFPLPPLEAMASGTSVVTTGLGTEDYAFHDRNALVVGSRDVRGMADAIIRLAKDPELRKRLAAEGRRTAEGYHWDRAVDEREKILLAIHRGETTYDVHRSAKFGEVDVNGTEFEKAPADLDQREDGMYWDDVHLFVKEAGTRRHVVRGELIPELIARGAGYIDIDPLEMCRTPIAPAMLSTADLPGTFRSQPAAPDQPASAEAPDLGRPS